MLFYWIYLKFWRVNFVIVIIFYMQAHKLCPMVFRIQIEWCKWNEIFFYKQSIEWREKINTCFSNITHSKTKKKYCAINHIIEWNENSPPSLVFIQQFENNRAFWSVISRMHEVNAMPYWFDQSTTKLDKSVWMNKVEGKKCSKTGGNQSIWLALSQQLTGHSIWDEGR